MYQLAINERRITVTPQDRIGEVFEDLATEVADELLFETFIELHPEISNLSNVNQENSNYERNRQTEEG